MKKVDSKEGIEAIMHFARVGHFVLTLEHKKTAEKYGVPTHGVIFSRQIPIHR